MRRRTTAEPMKPAPPVTKNRFFITFLNIADLLLKATADVRISVCRGSRHVNIVETGPTREVRPWRKTKRQYSDDHPYVKSTRLFQVEPPTWVF
jgi:hypothetical protein